MISKFGSLSLLSKLLFGFSLLFLFVWVIPTMINYYENVENYEKKVNKLSKVASQYDIDKVEADSFNINEFKENVSELFSEVFIVDNGDKSYSITIHMSRDKISLFNKFLETFSLRYLAKVEDTLRFEEQDKVLEVKMILKEL